METVSKMRDKTLLVVTGPTGVGKTELSMLLAEHYGSPILNADSRQLYRDIPIGTAAPSEEQLKRVQHYFVGTLSLDEYYSAACYEKEVMQLLPKLFEQTDTVVMSGGSMMYIDAVCNGIDFIPTVSKEVRDAVQVEYDTLGLEALVDKLRIFDPIHYARVDRKNRARVVHALEVCLQTGKPYSSFLTGEKKERPFKIKKVCLNRPRPELFERINNRVDIMMEEGLLSEVSRVYPLRHLNSLNTVGYKELFKYIEGEWELDYALNRMRKNTRVYAKKQLTWYKRDNEIVFMHPDTAFDEIISVE